MPEISNKKVVDLWEDLLHYIKVARADLALSYGKAILDSGATPRDIYLLSAYRADSPTTLAQGSRLPGLAETIDRLRKMIEDGYQAERADPEQIAKSIELLGSTLRGYQMGLERLKISGEHALPQLVQKLRDPRTSEVLRERIIVALPRLGKDAVNGLSCALQTKEAVLQEILASTLGKIEYPQAGPFLKELIERKDVLDRTRDVARAALIACSGRAALDKPISEMFFEMALRYYYQAESFRPDERYETAKVWYWQDGLGLSYKPVPREIFCDIYAMRMSRLALDHDPNFYPAVPLWISADLKKEADLPAGKTDPTHGAEQPGARFYALAGSAKYLQDVLARALQDRNSAVAFGAIEALAQTAGAKSLVEPIAGGAQPLVEALTFPDRNVQFLAALSLANALPDKAFTGSQMVIPVLNKAIRQTGKKAALLIAQEQDQRNALKDAVRAAGYELIDEQDPIQAFEAARASAGIDVVVLSAKPEATEILTKMRRDPDFLGTPVVVAAETSRNKSLAEADKRMVVIPAAAKADEIAQAMEKARGLGVGAALTDEKAADWSVQASRAVRQLALTGNPVYDVLRSVKTLVSALGDARAPVQIAASQALAAISSADAQQGVAALAVKADAAENVRVEAFNALGESVRRFGNKLTDAQAQQVVDVVTATGPLPVRDSAAKALGAMNLPSDKIKALILQTVGND